MAYRRTRKVQQEACSVHLGRTLEASCSRKVRVPLSLSAYALDSRDDHRSEFDSSEINYLCVHKKLRSKRLAPVLIKEVTRQCHLKGIFQAIYTAGVVIPTPVSTCRYAHKLPFHIPYTL